MSSQLTDQELEHFRKKFQQFDRDNCGRLDLWELRGLLSSVGQDPTEDELSLLISAVDDHGNGSVGFQQCVELLENMKKRDNKERGDKGTVAAFVAMGGNEDKSGELNTERLKTVVKDYRLSINIDGLLLDIDSDSSGYIDYEEFMTLLGD
uniref:EF-hand domain-containing protein n=1 Tax=Pyramimonas obovata TaxID=1411642 RepID=A0A7S0RS27_9CHLO|mmetsp:Transcript_4126/g.8464  ORF Transcript_4126/g.8464 Transcript_4126/m.8464 type:complete len:151 (+) Transcript_4126:283-735(+)|eukprot:CAMPEP_0118936544 /NCGR_PEP_ID=MMETSP1169-20130426/19420_1 /TAXON_ID=36882 /ORGANISM="Pyramimonas obovata, Strain CCMP722" /LENGTH=150 /DNA_ID=CAMNT_0006879843 /DNA_START=214 /DNA_END=666 /DNA_ORIENTATION=+